MLERGKCCKRKYSQAYPIKCSYGLIFRYSCFFLMWPYLLLAGSKPLKQSFLLLTKTWWLFLRPTHTERLSSVTRCCGNVFHHFWVVALFGIRFTCALYVLLVSLFGFFLGTDFHKTKPRNIPELMLLSNYMAKRDLSYRRVILQGWFILHWI